MDLRARLIQAIFKGAALAGVATLAIACDEDNASPAPWPITETNNTSQTNNTSSTTNNGTTHGTSHNGTTNNTGDPGTTNNTTNNGTTNNTNNTSTTGGTTGGSTGQTTTPPPDDCDADDLITLPNVKHPRGSFGGDSFPDEFLESGRYVVCAPSEGLACDDADTFTTREAIQAHVTEGLGQKPGCGYEAYVISDEVCGPIDRVTDECCYDIELTFSACAVGRPFIVDGLVRTAEVSQREGWCDSVQVRRGEGLPDEVRLAIAAAWADAGTHEHASVASFAQSLMELMALGAPRELIEATTRAIADEIRHAQTSFSIASSFAWQPLGPSELDTTPASHGPISPERVLRAVLAEGCIGETLAAAQAMTQATQVDDPELRQALETIAHEEGEHAELAWQIAAWMLGKWPELRPVAQAVLFGEPIREVGPWINSMTAIQEVMLRHGAMTPAPQDAARRLAFHAIVEPAATVLLAS